MMLITILIQTISILPVIAQDVMDTETFKVVIPPSLKVNGIGISPMLQTHGLPLNTGTEFNLLASMSTDGKSWQLTTSNPIGVSLSYNYSGSIMAVFVSMKRLGDDYEIPREMISIYPSKVIFDTAPVGGGDEKRIFHFNPIINVSKETPPGAYVGEITFTVIGE